jgi:hypothetical protein
MCSARQIFPELPHYQFFQLRYLNGHSEGLISAVCTLFASHCLTSVSRAGVARPVWFLTTDWTTGVRPVAEAEDFSCSLSVQTSSEAHAASYLTGTGGPYPRGKASPHLVPRSRMSRSYKFSLLGACMALRHRLILLACLSVNISLA